MTEKKEDTPKKWTAAEKRERIVKFVRELVRDNKGAYLNDRRFRQDFYRAHRALLEDLGQVMPELGEALEAEYLH